MDCFWHIYLGVHLSSNVEVIAFSFIIFQRAILLGAQPALPRAAVCQNEFEVAFVCVCSMDSRLCNCLV